MFHDFGASSLNFTIANCTGDQTDFGADSAAEVCAGEHAGQKSLNEKSASVPTATNRSDPLISGYSGGIRRARQNSLHGTKVVSNSLAPDEERMAWLGILNGIGCKVVYDG